MSEAADVNPRPASARPVRDTSLRLCNKDRNPLCGVLLVCRVRRIRRNGKFPEPGDRERAEALIVRSIETARRQGALSWELRTAISLTELWQSEGRRGRASDLLASTRSRFTEGFVTADLVRSTVVLENLRGSA